MADLKVCRICVRTEAKMYHLNQYQLKFYYEEDMALKINYEDGLPLHLCYECATILHKFHKFKEKCYLGQKVLKDLLWKGPITYESVYKMDRTEMLKSTLSMTVNNHIETTDIKDCKVNDSYLDIKTDIVEVENVELNYYSETSFSDHEDRMHDSFDIETVGDKKSKLIENKSIENNPTVVYIKAENESDIKKEQIKSKKGFDKLKALDNEDCWKKSVLSEKDAVKEFQAKVEDKKYLAATFKCKDCFKWFSKKNMLDRHVQLRHDESLGEFECRFCRYRFRLDCYLKRHMKQHYTRYECMRCHLICTFENTALLHEEYHSGITKKCNYCGEEFRHSSTYYTHLRTHRSEHVCTLCGASFVSQLGLHQHKLIKHVIVDIESPDDDEEVNTYCQRCDIRFETRKAYEKHLFHSALHSDAEGNKKNLNLARNKTDDENVEVLEKSTSKKVLSKKEQAKITKAISKRSTIEDPFDTKSLVGRKRFKRTSNRRQRKKPTTCHQCGKHFETQAACMKHHMEAHPRTSFHPPNERYICEICGASLAPGSIAVHQNIHTREKVHTCDTCGRQFHAYIGLKRHLVTHTGEKPFGCPLCDKKFTQSNSMKLHYRTFHLKQPYPKRNRRTKKDETKETVETRESNSEESTSSYDSPEQTEPTLNPVINTVNDETMNYLTLS